MSDQHQNAQNPRFGLPIAMLGYADSDIEILKIARHYFASYAMPEHEGWISALSRALGRFGQSHGPGIGLAVLSVTQAIRGTRASKLQFNSADCPCCSTYTTGAERLLMSAYRAVGRGEHAAAHAYAKLLCESASADAVIMALRVLEARVAAWRECDARSKASAAGATEALRIDQRI